MLKKILDSCRIIDWAEAGTLNDNFKKMFKNQMKIYIPDLVLKEIKGKLDEDPRILFEELYNEGVRKKLIVYAPKKYRLSKEFKKLFFRLSSTKEFHLSRTDMILIVLSAQTGAPIDTSDSGISDALAKLKTSINPWRKYFLNLEMQKKVYSEQLDFDFGDGE